MGIAAKDTSDNRATATACNVTITVLPCPNAFRVLTTKGERYVNSKGRC